MEQAENSKQELASLRALMTRVAKERDKRAFEKLFDHYAPLIRSYSLAREPGAELLADDLTQEVMIKLWQKAHLYNEQLSNPNTWIFTLARNCRIDYLRRNGRYVSEIDPTEIFNDMRDDVNNGPFQLAHQSYLQENIRTELKKLPFEQSEVLTKVYLEGKTHQQTCSELKLPLGTVKSRLRLALHKLQILVKR